MTHILPQHPDLGNGKHSSISSALEMEQQHQQQREAQLEQHAQQQQQNGHDAIPSAASRKRKKAVGDGEESMSASEPRRLRRSHEACARCRSKKIKASAVGCDRQLSAFPWAELLPQCDSKHPKCTACATAGVQCNQEDRHRKTLTPRGHVDKIERQLAQCEALLKRHITGFNLDELDTIVAREGVEVDYPVPGATSDQFQAQYGAGPSQSHGRPENGPPPKPYGYPPPHMMPPGYPPHMALPPGYPPPPPGYHMGMPYTAHMHPAFPVLPPSVADIKGQDPQANDMSNDQVRLLSST